MMTRSEKEKKIRYPTDARLCHRSIETLVRVAGESGVVLRQTYKRVAKRSMLKTGGYSKVRQMKRLKRETWHLKTLAGRARPGGGHIRDGAQDGVPRPRLQGARIQGAVRRADREPLQAAG